MSNNQYLEKIRLSNIRRFGPDLEIEFGKGATVLLAPNGTGKSTVFQAIELALTQGLRGIPLEVMVREGTEEARIDLLFGNELTSSAQYGNSEWNYSPFPSELFQGTNASDLPFVLKLTHFLDQADSKWIVRLDSAEAGDHVNRLSVAKEANKANSALSSAVRQGNKRYEDAKFALLEERKIESQWKDLQIRLEASLPKSTEALISFRDGNESIQELTDALGLPKFPEASEVNSLRSNWAVVSSTCKQRLESAKTRLVTLNALKIEIPDFLRLQANLGTLDGELTKLVEEKGILENEVNRLLGESENERLSLKTSQDKFSAFKLTQKKWQELEDAIAHGAAQMAEIEALNKSLAELGEEIRSAIELRDKENEILRQHQGITNRETELTQKRQQLEALNMNLPRWKEEARGLEKIVAETKPALLANLATAKIDSDAAKLKVEVAKKARNETEVSLADLARIDGIVQKAVSDIASNFPPERDDCPLCGTGFDPGQLHLSILETIKKSNPQLGALQQQLESQKEKESEESWDEGRKTKTLTGLQEQLRVLEADQEQRARLLASEIQNMASGAKSIEEAIQYIENQTSAAQLLADQISELKLKTPATPSQARMEELKDAVDRLLEKEEAGKASKIKLENSLRQNTSMQSQLQNQLLEAPSLAAVSKLIEEEQDVQGKIEARIVSLAQKSEIEKDNVASKNLEISRKEAEISAKNVTLEENRVRWNNGGLEGDPNDEVAQGLIRSANDEVSSLSSVQSRIDLLDIEFKRVEGAADYLEVVRKIDEMLQGKTKEAYESELSSKLRRVEDQHRFTKRRNDTLHQLGVLLNMEIDQAELFPPSTKIAISSILERIVLDPKFVSTQFPDYSRYRKVHFESKIGLGPNKYDVKHIASEAQLTDIQLAMLLANAQTRQWSPWRALLLDDPTQHHDLVHASGVFDVLRDFIVDLDFQVLMATHDSVQANFFVRKLQNDGVPVKLYSLYASENGVRAKRHE